MRSFDCGHLLQRAVIASIFSATAMTVASRAQAHADDPYQHAYYEFLSGFEATISEGSVLLLLVATALMVGIQCTGTTRKTWLFLLFGMVLGGLIGAVGWIPPILPTYGATILVGVLAAVSPKIGDHGVRATLTAIAAIMTNAMLSGYDWRQIPPLAYLGVATALLLGMAVVYLIVRYTVKIMPYGWVLITWRTLASWIVAIAVLMLALRIGSTG